MAEEQLTLLGVVRASAANRPYSVTAHPKMHDTAAKDMSKAQVTGYVWSYARRWIALWEHGLKIQILRCHLERLVCLVGFQ